MKDIYSQKKVHGQIGRNGASVPWHVAKEYNLDNDNVMSYWEKMVNTLYVTLAKKKRMSELVTMDVVAMDRTIIIVNLDAYMEFVTKK